ncbi:MAG: SusC/RagA family TonB-linked outer membrane protein [Chryseolinea sp.]
MKKCSKKLWKIMKLCGPQIVIGLIFCGVTLANNGKAQILEKRITLDLHEVTLEETLYAIERAAGINIYFSIESVSKDLVPVSMTVTNEKLSKVLDEVLTARAIEFKIDVENNRIIIVGYKVHTKGRLESRTSSEGRNRSSTNDLLVVTGRVQDKATKQPLAGVNIVVKNTTMGTTTDAQGHYGIAVDDGNILVFSFIGYQTSEVAVSGRTSIDVDLEEDVKSLNEVVINAGYWKVADKERTGNIVKVESEVIDKQPVQNPIAALQGRVAGLEITQSTGVPGGNFRVRIRGTNSIANGNDPLYIVDGVPYTNRVMTFNETSAGILGNSSSPLGGTSPLNTLNPADIESIEVLKDADATAIYGSRGANGVILITTKRGKSGKATVDATFYSGAGTVSDPMKLLSTPDYVSMRKEAFRNDQQEPDPGNARDLFVWDTTRYTDWQRQLIGGTANITEARVGLSGGDSNTQFSIGSTYHRESTVFPGDNRDQRIAGHASITNTAFNSKLRTTLTANYSLDDTSLPGQDLTSRSVYLPPNAPSMYNEDGSLNWEGWDTSGSFENPLAFLHRPYEANTTSFVSSLQVAYSILPNLEVTSRFGYTATDFKSTNLVPVSSLSPSIAATSVTRVIFLKVISAIGLSSRNSVGPRKSAGISSTCCSDHNYLASSRTDFHKRPLDLSARR